MPSSLPESHPPLKGSLDQASSRSKPGQSTILFSPISQDFGVCISTVTADLIPESILLEIIADATTEPEAYGSVVAIFTGIPRVKIHHG